MCTPCSKRIHAQELHRRALLAPPPPSLNTLPFSALHSVHRVLLPSLSPLTLSGAQHRRSSQHKEDYQWRVAPVVPDVPCGDSAQAGQLWAHGVLGHATGGHRAVGAAKVGVPILQGGLHGEGGSFVPRSRHKFPLTAAAKNLSHVAVGACRVCVHLRDLNPIPHPAGVAAGSAVNAQCAPPPLSSPSTHLARTCVCDCVRHGSCGCVGTSSLQPLAI
jgi:hypothetical protein